MKQLPTKTEEEWRRIATDVGERCTYEYNTQIRPYLRENPTIHEQVDLLIRKRNFSEYLMLQYAEHLDPENAAKFGLGRCLLSLNRMGKIDPLMQREDDTNYINTLVSTVEHEESQHEKELETFQRKFKDGRHNARDWLLTHLNYALNLLQTYKRHLPQESLYVRFLKKIPFLDEWVDKQQRAPFWRANYGFIQKQQEAIRGIYSALNKGAQT